ncbi:MAG TPA: DUF748 domain-containing protein [Burkholderiales bacterium]|nr:DUF748 domain-containing protein [Burkholderiales bacterium]
MYASFFPLAERVVVVATSRRARRLSWTLAGLLVVFAAVGFFAVPPILKSKLEETLSQLLHRKVTVEAVRVNPFAPSVTVRGLSVRERTGDVPFVRFDELYANAAWTSIFYLAPVVDEITLVKPQLRLVRNPDRTYNLQDLLDEFMARPKSDAPVPKFALFNIRVVDGRIDFDDRAEAEKHEVSDLRIGIPFLSSLPADAEVKVAPELSMMVNGALLSLTGDALPFQGTHAAVLNLDVHSVNLTRLTDYLPFQPRAKLADGVLDARLAIAFEQPPGSAPVVKLRGSSAVRRLSLLDLENRPVLAWKRLGIELNEVQPLAPRIDLKSVELEGADVHLRRDKTGAINFARLGPAAAAARAEAQSDPLFLKIDRIAAKLDRVRITDETTTPAFDTVFAGELQVSALDLQEGRRSEWTVSMRGNSGEGIKLTAVATAALAVGEGRLDIAAIDLKRYQPYVDQAANLRIDDGKLDLGLAFKWDKNDLALADVAVALKSLHARLAEEKQPLIRIGSLEMKGARVEVGTQTANLGEITIGDMALRLRRGADGVLDVARIAKADRSEKNEQPGSPWRIDLDRATLQRGAATFEDLALGEPAAIINIAPLEMKAEKLSTAKGTSGSINVRATIDKKGTLAAVGPLTLDPLGARLDIVARTIGLLPAQRYIDDKVHIAITSGRLSAKGTASFEMPAGGALKAAYRGGVEVADFASIDKRSTHDLLRWKALSLAAIDFELEPLKLSVDEIGLSEYYARIIVTADGGINLQELVKESDAPTQATAAPAPKVRIGKITARDGNVNFSDFFIRPNFSANLTGFGGSVTEMTREKAGDVELRGKIDNAAPVEIAGRVNLLGSELFLDMKASARDIELAPLSAYAVKYAGYGIQRGKLSLALKYGVENRKLSAENQIYLDQLTFGERVESPTATTLPVLLAVALLKDRNGVIDVNLPISGSLDDPQFSVGGIVLQVIGNLVVKAVTSPFALLGSLVGGGEELSFVEFAPGSATLADGEQQKLGNLAKALTERPNLRLEITGRAAADPDEVVLKRAALDTKVRTQKFNELRRAGTAPESADSVTVEPAEYESYLRRAYGAEKLPDKPRNFLGIAKELPVPEMEGLMLAHTNVGKDDLQRLANSRAQAAKEWLMTQGKVPAERLFINAPVLAAPEKGKPTRVDFGLK